MTQLKPIKYAEDVSGVTNKTTMNEETPVEKYCREQSYKLAQRIDDKMAFVIKPRPKYCPEWLYKKIIKDSVEIVKVN